MLFTAFCVVLYFVSRFSCIATIQRLLLCVNERNEIQYNPTCTQTRKHCHMWIQMIEEVWKVSFCFCLLMIASASMWWICGSNFSKFKSKNFKCSCVIFSAIFSAIRSKCCIFCALATLDGTCVVLIDLNARTQNAFFCCRWHSAEYTYVSY